MRIEIDPEEPESWFVARAADLLRRGNVAVIPTDTLYGIACALSQTAAIERIYGIKNLDPKKSLSILVRDLAMAGPFLSGVSNASHRLMKRALPGPYTFICRASRDVPKIMLRKRDTIGIRIPDNRIVLALLDELREPMLTTSVRTPDDEIVNDPNEISERLFGSIDLVIDGGPLRAEPSTIIDLTEDEPVLVRAGKGDLASLGLTLDKG